MKFIDTFLSYPNFSLLKILANRKILYGQGRRYVTETFLERRSSQIFPVLDRVPLFYPKLFKIYPLHYGTYLNFSLKRNPRESQNSFRSRPPVRDRDFFRAPEFAKISPVLDRVPYFTLNFLKFTHSITVLDRDFSLKINPRESQNSLRSRLPVRNRDFFRAPGFAKNSPVLDRVPLFYPALPHPLQGAGVCKIFTKTFALPRNPLNRKTLWVKAAGT